MHCHLSEFLNGTNDFLKSGKKSIIEREDQKIIEIVQKDRRLSVQMIADVVNPKKQIVRKVWNNNKLHRIVCKNNGFFIMTRRQRIKR